jgi:hypothetical protein
MNQFSGICRTIVMAIFMATFCFAGPARSELATFNPDNVPAAPDYAHKASWLALPDNPDQYAVDVFWVYPTINCDATQWLMPITDKILCTKAANTLTTQASVFSIQANLYAPFYRQMNMAGLGLPEKDRDTIMSYGKQDVWHALNHYLKHSNKGRPFILAGHSQGSNILTDLMIDHWGKLRVEKRLVAAYLIGWSVTPEDLKTNPALEICKSATQTGCIITYNTMAPGKQEDAPTRIPGTFVVNPLTWSTTDKKGAAAMNLGSAFFHDDGTVLIRPGFTSAQIVDCGLVVEPADPSLLASPMSTFPQGVYHPFDYALFYKNLMANVAERIQNMLDKQ